MSSQAPVSWLRTPPEPVAGPLRLSSALVKVQLVQLKEDICGWVAVAVDPLLGLMHRENSGLGPGDGVRRHVA